MMAMMPMPLVLVAPPNNYDMAAAVARGRVAKYTISIGKVVDVTIYVV